MIGACIATECGNLLFKVFDAVFKARHAASPSLFKAAVAANSILAFASGQGGGGRPTSASTPLPPCLQSLSFSVCLQVSRG